MNVISTEAICQIDGLNLVGVKVETALGNGFCISIRYQSLSATV